jgi:Skp family chaperone for outer membrane proteins
MTTTTLSSKPPSPVRHRRTLEERVADRNARIQQLKDRLAQEQDALRKLRSAEEKRSQSRERKDRVRRLIQLGAVFQKETGLTTKDELERFLGEIRRQTTVGGISLLDQAISIAQDGPQCRIIAW